MSAKILIPPFLLFSLFILPGCRTLGEEREGASMFESRDNRQSGNRAFADSRTDTRLAAAESAIADLRAEINDLNTALVNAEKKAEREARFAGSENRTEIAALRMDLAALRDKVENLPAAITKLLDDREKKIVAYVDKSVKTAASAAKPPAVPQNNSFVGEVYVHTIQSGETLSAIAQAYSEKTGKRVTVNEILSANNITDPGKLRVNQKINIPKK